MSMKKNPKAATAAELEQRFDDGEDITEIADIDPESVIKRRPGGGGGSSRRGGSSRSSPDTTPIPYIKKGLSV